MKKSVRRKTIPEGELSVMLAQAKNGDVLSIPCFVYTPAGDVLGTHDFVSLYACVLLVTRSHIVLSRLYEQIGHIEPVACTTVYDTDTHVPLFDEHGRSIEWHSKSTCRLLRRRRIDLAEDYFESLTPEGPVDGTH